MRASPKLKGPAAQSGQRQTVLHAWNELDMGLQDVGGPIGLLSETSPDPRCERRLKLR